MVHCGKSQSALWEEEEGIKREKWEVKSYSSFRESLDVTIQSEEDRWGTRGLGRTVNPPSSRGPGLGGVWEEVLRREEEEELRRGRKSYAWGEEELRQGEEELRQGGSVVLIL